ncbi:hypothetical protein K4K49_011135 [Colletotrichum sp. SAR 10_70]|nr:hypothetical protein K4K50_011110 [Colletotrichum sp. SAR 10_71]KAI8151859.1 hypothetical protein K4K49_011135 [Colletotrichum sp. SAR 10_70]
MDPLSFTVAAAQLLGAVNSVILIVARYNEEMKKTPRDLLRFVEELRGLRHVLESLESLVLKAKSLKADISTDSNIQALIPLYEPLTLYLDDIKTLQSKLEMPNLDMKSRRRRSLVIALGWPLKEDEGKRELEKMKAFREQLKDAMQVDTLHITVANQRILKENQRVLTELVKSWRAKETTDFRRELHRWLAAPDPTINYQAALKKRSDATGSWLTESKMFTEWMENSRSFIWLYGIPGCGKTILTTTAIEHATKVSKQVLGRAIAYFYFDFNDKEKQLTEKMIRSILKQLSLQCPETPHALSSLFDSCGESDRQPTVDELLVALQNVFRSFCDIYIILDALDECGDPEEALDFLDRIMSWEFEHLHILASSRPERLLEETIKTMTTEQNRIHLQSHVIDNDIRTYVQGRLQTDTKLKKWDKLPGVKDEIEEKLMQKADGMFRLVACQLDELTSCLNRPQLQQRLRALPKTLDTMYASMLGKISEDNEESALRIFQWLTYSARPLSTIEVAETMCINIDGEPPFDAESRYPDPRDILGICPSLIMVAESNSDDDVDGQAPGEPVQLAHYSVKEFLVSKSIQKLAPSFSIKEADANASIAESCLAYLLSFEDENAVVPGFLEEFPLANYAARYWISHARTVDTHERVIDLIMRLLDETNPAYTNWVQIFNPDRPWDPPAGLRRTYRQDSVLQTPPSPLYIASLTGLAEATSRLLTDTPVDVDSLVPTGDYGTPLQAASHGGHDDVVRLLLDAGADVDSQAGLYSTALQAASFQGHSKVVNRILAAGADVNRSGGKYANPLHAAAREGHLAIVQRLLAAGADVAAQGGFYGFPLQGAAFYGHDKVVAALLAAGADVNQQSGGIYGTALQAAARNGYDAVIGLLLDAGADVNAMDGMYHTALQSAARGAQTGHKEVIQLLRDAGADVAVDAYDTVQFTVPVYGDKVISAIVGDAPTPVSNVEEAGMSGDVNIQHAAETIKFCDECGKAIPDEAKYYHCAICLNDDWDSCEDCVNQGFPCRDRRHKMTLRQIKDGIIMDVNSEV